MNTPTRWLLATLTAILMAWQWDAPTEHEAAVDVHADVDQAVADAKEAK